MSVFSSLLLGASSFRDGVPWLATACIASMVLLSCVVGPSAAEVTVQHDGNRVRIEGITRLETKWADPFAQSIALALTSAGHPTDYETVMGDSGMAFVMQASQVVPILGPNGRKVGDAPKDLGKVVGRRDVGWWPLALECAPTYVQFVGQAAGRELHVLWPSRDYPDPKTLAVRHKKMHSEIVASIDSGRPVVVGARCPSGCCFWSVDAGYDKGNMALLSFCPLGGPDALAERRDNAMVAVILGNKVEKMDRRLADREALRHAVALARDEVKMPSDYLTGQRAYALWASELRQMDPPGQPRWHTNVCNFLTLRRRAAVTYLEVMSRRQEEPTRAYLLAAVDRYKEVLEVLKTADTSRKAMTSIGGREALALLAERLAKIEAEAARQLEQATKTIR